MRKISWRDATLVNICDADIIGKTLSEGKLKMHISREYFGGQMVGGTEALSAMKNTSIINLAGEKSVGMAISNELASREAVRFVQGVPFLMIYKFSH